MNPNDWNKDSCFKKGIYLSVFVKINVITYEKVPSKHLRGDTLRLSFDARFVQSRSVVHSSLHFPFTVAELFLSS